MQAPTPRVLLEWAGMAVALAAVYLLVQYITVVYFTTWAASGDMPKPFEWQKGWEEFICIYRECDGVDD